MDSKSIRNADPEADRSKCGAEINQLQQQQFLLAGASLTLFGVYMSAAVARLGADPAHLSSAVSVQVLGACELLAVLGVLFSWVLYLRRTVLVISTWLEASGVSAWERDARRFSKEYSISSTVAVAYVFLVIGILIPGSALVAALYTQVPVHPCLWTVMGLESQMYLGAVYFFGIRNRTPTPDEVRARWEAQLRPPTQANGSE